MDYWAKRGRGRGTFQRGRGRFNFKKSGSSPKWTHDKYQGDGIVEDEEETIENSEDKDRRKEEKVRSLVNCRLDSLSCVSSDNHLSLWGYHFKRFQNLVINSLQQDCFLSLHRNNPGRKL